MKPTIIVINLVVTGELIIHNNLYNEKQGLVDSDVGRIAKFEIRLFTNGRVTLIFKELID